MHEQSAAFKQSPSRRCNALLQHADPAKGTVDVFVRELYQSSGAAAPDLPYLVYLQGGPGFECPR